MLGTACGFCERCIDTKPRENEEVLDINKFEAATGGTLQFVRVDGKWVEVHDTNTVTLIQNADGSHTLKHIESGARMDLIPGTNTSPISPVKSPKKPNEHALTRKDKIALHFAKLMSCFDSGEQWIDKSIELAEYFMEKVDSDDT